ncbi:MAG TPA: DinB family protein, partial [Caldilineaceae bacterium]|nr:DinB family protein [Caldilineaceae bacterium]
MSNPNALLITPVEGFSPHIGVLVATMQRCRETTIRWVQDLTVAQLDYLWDEQANTIGALLLHMAAIEAAYQEYTFTGRNILDNPERIAKWHTPMYLDDAARQTIKGQPVTYYLDELAAMRELTLAQFRHYDDDWLWQESGWNDTVANNYWMWYHVYEDEINHRGEISWLKSRIPV